MAQEKTSEKINSDSVAYIFFNIVGMKCALRGLFRRDLFACLTEASFTFLVVGDGEQELLLVEVGPECVGEIEFGVGCLPNHEVADAIFATGADE